MKKPWMSFKNRLIAATPLIAVLIFLFVGFQFDTWHPTWLVFLLVPLMPVLLGIKKIRGSFSLAVAIIYVVLGFVIDDFWHPGWLIFLTIPIYHTLFPSFPFSKKEEETLKD